MFKRIRGIRYSGISDDSRAIKKGDLFFAVSGARFNGSQFIKEALDKGAAAVIVDKAIKAQGAKVMRVANVRQELARRACEFYNNPSKKMNTIGVTGTNGKTTVTYLLAAILKKAGRKPGIIGTIAHRWGDNVIDAKNTTPGALELQRLLNEMAKGGVDYCAMEVSSHSLDQDRVCGTDFKTAVFTNVTSEHLDYHKTFENYIKAKARLFGSLKRSSLAVLNCDDENFKFIRNKTRSKVLTYGIKKDADLRAEAITAGPDRTEFLVRTKEDLFLITSPLIGVFNVYNILAAIAVALEEGVGVKTIKEAVAGFKGAQGRLEPVGGPDAPFKVFVDFAHTDGALKNVLAALRDICKKRLITVFGCGGDRDRFKRPRMGEVACRFSDFVVITSDNPRSEEPLSIAREIEAGIDRAFRSYKVILNRFDAISEAIGMAGDGDVVLIAGKGHERYQILGDKVLPFSDMEAAKKIISKKGLPQKCLV